MQKSNVNSCAIFFVCVAHTNWCCIGVPEWTWVLQKLIYQVSL